MSLLKNARHELFALGVASGLSATQAYIKAGYSTNGADRSAARLLGNVGVRARVDELKASISERVIEVEISNRQKRVNALNDRWLRMRKVIEERANDPEMTATTAEGVPIVAGGSTGLLCKTLKSIGFGENNQVVEEFVVDTALLREIRAHEQQAAQELGQWTEKRELTGKDGGPLTIAVLDELLEESPASQAG